MQTSTAIFIAATPQTIYSFAAATERWPEILPHYRYVYALEGRGSTGVMKMGARRDFIPISWVAEQTNDPDLPAITFRHIRGWTRGMDVTWRFEPGDGGTLVTIDHHLKFAFPIASEWLGEHLVGDFFVDYIARKTLARMKVLAEAQHE